ncbi:MAG: hypothetical protein IPG61_03515 [bacterium]|nr:hypothetical protein [bacterium]
MRRLETACIILVLGVTLPATSPAQITIVDAFSAIPNAVFNNIVHASPCGAHYHAPFVIDTGGGHLVTVSYYSEVVEDNYQVGCISLASSSWDHYRLPNDWAVDPGDYIGEYISEGLPDGDLILNFSEPLTGFGSTSIIGPFATSLRPNDADRFLVYDGPNGTGNVLADVTTADIIHLSLFVDFKGVVSPTPIIRSVRYVNVFAGVSVDGWAIAAAAQPSGVTDLQPGVTGALLTLSPPTPSPFGNSTRLALDLTAAGHVRVEVFQLDGRRVRTLMDGEASAGANMVVWDGRDDRGRRVSSGVYLINVSRGSETASRRVTFVR